jgi:type I restriction enzyme S subunit
VVTAMTDLKQDAPILGSAGVIPSRGQYLHNQRIGKVVVTARDRLEPSFLPWLLNSPDVRTAVRASATGSTVRHTAPSRIADIRVAVPDTATQRRIAGVLSAFDDRIEITGGGSSCWRISLGRCFGSGS